MTRSTEKGASMATLPTTKRSAEVAEFIERLKPAARAGTGHGRLVFALDATASRERTWDHAAQLQGEMFEATTGLGGLDVKLIYYRGRDECRASRWMASAAGLHRGMAEGHGEAGETQIAKILTSTIDEAAQGKINGVVFVGDACEENPDRLCSLARELGRLGVPLFMFYEHGEDLRAKGVFRQLADLSHGACFDFDTNSAERLRARWAPSRSSQPAT